MRLLLSLFCIIVILHCSFAPPVTPDKSKEQDSDVKDDLEDYMEYHRYLKEVVQTLESDPEFRERLEKADEDDVRSGKVAEQLDFVNHNVRTKLDEIKRRELERLRHLATKQFELDNNLDTDVNKVSNEHLDHANPHTFEIEDLKKLIKKTTADLEAADKQRKQQFKEYEMEKEFEKHQKTEKMDENQKKEFLEKEKQNVKKPHQPIHHPGSKPQLEEVWEKQDHMDQQFDPKTFFMMHDVDGNGVWDADEVKALFIKELDKIYGPNGPNTDLHERAEEMERMREHVFKENDRNRDGLIDLHEFMMETQKANFNNDEGWKSIDENQIYTPTEYEEFERRRLEEIRYLQEHGLIDAQGRPIPGAQHKLQQYQQLRALQEQQARLQHGQPQYYPQGQMPQGQQVPHQGYQQGQIPNQGYQAHPPQGQFQGQFQGQQQPPQGQFQGQQQPPQGQFQGQQPPQGQFQGQQPPQGQFQAQQPPQDHFQAQQIPQGHVQAQQPPQFGGQGQLPKQPTLNVNQGEAPLGQQAQPAVAQGFAQQVPPQGQAAPVQGQAQGAGQSQVPPAQAQGSPANLAANH